MRHGAAVGRAGPVVRGPRAHTSLVLYIREFLLNCDDAPDHVVPGRVICSVHANRISCDRNFIGMLAAMGRSRRPFMHRPEHDRVRRVV